MKIAFVFGKALPYRISFFLKLSRFFDVDLFLESVETTNVLEANLCYECYRTFNVPFLSKYGSYMRCMHAVRKRRAKRNPFTAILLTLPQPCFTLWKKKYQNTSRDIHASCHSDDACTFLAEHRDSQLQRN